jgi:cathepsin F
MKKIFNVLLSIALISCEYDTDSIIFQSFQKFIKKYNKKYSSMNEYLARYQVFRMNYMKSTKQKNSSYKTGITKFSDLTFQEFSKTYLNLNYNAMALQNLSPVDIEVSNDTPEAYDWRDYGRVSGVKDQLSCGSCYAFATCGNLEGLYAANRGVLKTFSEQFLVDCDTGDSGCNGGLMQFTFNWLKNNGIMYEADYPYTGEKGTCKSDSSKYADFQITGYEKLGNWWTVYSCVDETKVRDFLLKTGPVAISLNATPLFDYVSGIIDVSKDDCGKDGINHAVTLVGYGTDATTGLDYWIIKNSWGKEWGESGYFRMRRGAGTCGCNCYVITATVKF